MCVCVCVCVCERERERVCLKYGKGGFALHNVFVLGAADLVLHSVAVGLEHVGTLFLRTKAGDMERVA